MASAPSRAPKSLGQCLGRRSQRHPRRTIPSLEEFGLVFDVLSNRAIGLTCIGGIVDRRLARFPSLARVHHVDGFVNLHVAGLTRVLVHVVVLLFFERDVLF
jgi:hypothetical protein